MNQPRRPEETPAPRAGAYVVSKLRALDVVLVETAPRLLAKPAGNSGASPRSRAPVMDDEAVHDLRVAIRRMRTLLKMARPIFGRWHTNAVREAFADVMRATGELRDEEVLEETLDGAAAATEYTAWLKQRKTREAKLRRAVALRIERGDLDRARLMLKALLVFPIDPERNLELARFARRTVEGARRKVEKQRDAEVTDVVGMHDLRIAYKELRYSIELLSDALPIDARAQLEPATVFQKRLGELHDVDVAIDVVQKAKVLPPGAREDALAALAVKRQKRVARYLRELDPLGAGAGFTEANGATVDAPPKAGAAPLRGIAVDAPPKAGGAPLRGIAVDAPPKAGAAPLRGIADVELHPGQQANGAGRSAAIPRDSADPDGSSEPGETGKNAASGRELPSR